MVSVTALSPGDVMTLCRMRRRSEHSNSGLLQFSVCRGEGLEGMGERAGECARWTAIHPELREGFQISPLTFFWAQRSPRTEVAQNWHRPPGCCQGQPLCRGVAGAQHCFVFRSHLTSWFGKGGWRIINQQKDPYYTVCPHVTRPQDKLTHLHSVSYFCLHSVAQVFLFSL